MTQAYRHAFKPRGKSIDVVRRNASDLFRRLHVDSRVKALLAVANIQDIDSVGAAFADLHSDIELARGEGNMTAVAQLQRLRLQVLGMLKENVNLSVEQRTDDETLVSRIAGDDKDLAESLRRRLAKDTFDA
jgi:hypothetical protein